MTVRLSAHLRVGFRAFLQAPLVESPYPKIVAMKISGHKTRSVFDRYNLTSEEDLKQAAEKLNLYIQTIFG